MATTYDNNVFSSISVNLLNNLQGGKMRKLTKKEKEILTNYEALSGIKEDTILNGGKVILKKASLDEYDNQGSEDNQEDIDFGLNKLYNLDN